MVVHFFAGRTKSANVKATIARLIAQEKNGRKKSDAGPAETATAS